MSRGNVRGKDVTSSVVIANGDVEVDEADQAVIVADGRVFLRGAARHSVIVSRRDLTVFLPVRSTVAAGGRVYFHHPEGRRALGRDETVLEGVAGLLGLVRFTSRNDLGVDVALSLDGPARVAVTVPGGLFSHRVFRAGDEILRVNDAPVASASDFRRLVRDADAVGREVIVTASRDGRPFGVRAAGR